MLGIKTGENSLFFRVAGSLVTVAKRHNSQNAQANNDE